MIKCIAASLIASLISTIAFGQNLPDSHYGPGPTLSGSSPVFTGLTLSGLTQCSVLFAGAGGMLSQDNPNFCWDETNHRLGIGTNIPDTALTVNVTNVASPVADPGVYIHIIGNSNAPQIQLDDYSAAPQIGFRVALGTGTSPSAVTLGTVLGNIGYKGYGATGFPSSSKVLISAVAAENWTDTAQGAYLTIGTTPTGTTTRSERVRIAPNGNLGIGNTNPQALLSIGTTAGSLGVNNAFTDAANYEVARFDWNVSNVLTIGTDKAGTGTTRNVQFVVGGTNKLDYGITNAATWTFAAGIVSTTGIHTAAAPTVSAGQVGFGGTVAATGNCGTLSGDSGCLVINVAGTTRYIPYY